MIPVIPAAGFRESLFRPCFQRFRAEGSPGPALIHLNQASGGPRRQHRLMETQSATPRSVERLSRPEAIERLRQKLRSLTDADHCVCSVVGQLGIFCRGFQALPEKELRSKYHWIARKRPKAPREAIEELANFYHLGRQEVTGAAICCDLETREHGGCDGWNNFDNRKLEEFYLALTGEEAEIG